MADTPPASQTNVPEFVPYNPVKTFLGQFNYQVNKSLEPLDKGRQDRTNKPGTPGYAKGVSKVGPGSTRLGMVSRKA